jgi:hypothetical protein
MLLRHTGGTNVQLQSFVIYAGEWLALWPSWERTSVPTEKKWKEIKIWSNTCTALLAKCTVKMVTRLSWLCEELRLWVEAITQCYRNITSKYTSVLPSSQSLSLLCFYKVYPIPGFYDALITLYS